MLTGIQVAIIVGGVYLIGKKLQPTMKRNDKVGYITAYAVAGIGILGMIAIALL